MTLTGIIICIIIVVAIYYGGMIVWDSYRDKFNSNDKNEIQEEEIDIGREISGIDNEPILVEVPPATDEPAAQTKKVNLFQFPWTSEQIKLAFEKIDLGEECKDLENVLFFNQNSYKQAI